MGYDYRSYLNTIITLLQQLNTSFTDFVSKFDAFVLVVSGFWDSLLGVLPSALFFLILLVASQFVLKLFFPRWRDV